MHLQCGRAKSEGGQEADVACPISFVSGASCPRCGTETWDINRSASTHAAIHAAHGRSWTIEVISGIVAVRLNKNRKRPLMLQRLGGWAEAERLRMQIWLVAPWVLLACLSQLWWSCGMQTLAFNFFDDKFFAFQEGRRRQDKGRENGPRVER